MSGTENNGNQLKQCESCGSWISQSAAFCGVCGQKSEVEEERRQVRFCRSCGFENDMSADFCKNCGCSLSTRVDDKPKKSGKKYIFLILSILAVLILTVCIVLGMREAPEDEFDFESATPTPQVTAAAADEEAAEPEEKNEESLEKLETYYVVNCTEKISLREAPDVSANVIKEIFLGEPVSYVKPSKNGFAEIIHNGTTGYALQSYLSADVTDVKNSSKAATKATQRPTAAPTQYSTGYTGGGYSAKYDMYTDGNFKFSCMYPVDFNLINGGNPLFRASYRAKDGSATLNICACYNSSKLSVKTVLDNFKSSYPGKVDYEKKGSDWCACRTYEGAVYHYAYFKVNDGMIRGFELHFDAVDYAEYDALVNKIYDSLQFN